MSFPLPRRDLLRFAALIAGGSLLTRVTGCAAAPTEALARSGVPRQRPGTAIRSSLDPFGAALLDGVAGANRVLSPFSVAAVLAMLANGASGPTRAEFEAVLGSRVEALNAELNATLQALAASGTRNGLDLTPANAVWAQQGPAWKPPFLDALASFYGAGIRQTDFAGDPGAAVRAINAWADQATKGLIPTIVDDSMISTDTRLAVGNAIHFKGSWEDQFDERDTTPMAFTTGSGTTVSAPMMAGDRTLPWLETPSWTGAALPFSGGELAMALLLPAPDAPASLTELTSSVGLADLLAAPAAPLMLVMPRWKARTNARLEGPLQALGLRRAFDSLNADFSGMTDSLRLALQFVVHEATITVDETGAEAAAVTVGGVGVESAPLPHRVLRLDRPFYWSIMHVPTRTALFLGRVDDPTR